MRCWADHITSFNLVFFPLLKMAFSNNLWFPYDLKKVETIFAWGNRYKLCGSHENSLSSLASNSRKCSWARALRSGVCVFICWETVFQQGCTKGDLSQGLLGPPDTWVWPGDSPMAFPCLLWLAWQSKTPLPKVYSLSTSLETWFVSWFYGPHSLPWLSPYFPSCRHP